MEGSTFRLNSFSYYGWASFANGTSSANGHFPPATLTHRGWEYFFRPFSRLGSRLQKRFIEIGAKMGGVAGNRGVTEEDLLKRGQVSGPND
jgi:hypothetical protein